MLITDIKCIKNERKHHEIESIWTLLLAGVCTATGLIASMWSQEQILLNVFLILSIMLWAIAIIAIINYRYWSLRYWMKLGELKK